MKRRNLWTGPSGSLQLAYSLLLVVVAACDPGESLEEDAAPVTRPANVDSGPLATTRVVFAERLDAGLDFRHRRYMNPQAKYLPETAGSGLGLLDYDGDGDLDIYFVQGSPLPDYPGDQPGQTNRLYRNDGQLHFTDVTEEAGVGERGYGMGVTCPDIDNDGDPDLYVTNLYGNVLYRNRGDGTFEDITAHSGLGDESWSTAAGWFDYDRDGDLDLYLANYAKFDRENYQVCGNREVISYCHPDTFASSPDRLFQNRGGARFIEVTAKAGIVDTVGKGLAVLPFDHDGDGNLDLFVANDSNENFLWMNRGDGTFEEMAGLLGVAVNGKGGSQACMGTDIGDVDGDLDFDIFSANFGRESNVLYLRVEGDFYEDRTYPAGLGEDSYYFTGFGSELFDYDRDGDLDLIVVNGHIVDVIAQLDSTQTFEQVPHFYENLGQGQFREIGATLGPYFGRRHLGRGLAVGDLDDDGDLDVVVSNNDGPCALLENRHAGTGHWIGLSLRGTASPRDAIGARVHVTCAERTQVEEIRATSSYLSWADLRLFFGWGESEGPCQARIRWPSGRVQILEGLELDRYHLVVEPVE